MGGRKEGKEGRKEGELGGRVERYGGKKGGIVGTERREGGM